MGDFHDCVWIIVWIFWIYSLNLKVMDSMKFIGKKEKMMRAVGIVGGPRKWQMTDSLVDRWV